MPWISRSNVPINFQNYYARAFPDKNIHAKEKKYYYAAKYMSTLKFPKEKNKIHAAV